MIDVVLPLENCRVGFNFIFSPNVLNDYRQHDRDNYTENQHYIYGRYVAGTLERISYSNTRYTYTIRIYISTAALAALRNFLIIKFSNNINNTTQYTIYTSREREKERERERESGGWI